MRLLIALLTLSLLTACRWESDTYCDPRERMLPVRPDEDTMFYQHEICKIINTYATEIEYYHQVWMENCYANFEDGKFYLFLDFTTQTNLDLIEARRMSVRMIESILKRLNANQLLVSRQGGPFTPENLYFSIEYTSFYGKYIDILLVGRSELKYGFLNIFYAHDAFMLDPVIYHKHSEPYEISKCIVFTQDRVRKELKPNAERAYDEVVGPENWMTGTPDYVRKPTEEFNAYDFNFRSTLTNYPKSEEQLPSGAVQGTNVWSEESGAGGIESDDDSQDPDQSISQSAPSKHREELQ